jgi:hypothetical protein
VLERPDLLAKLVDVPHQAKDSTARQTAMRELQAMVPRTSQYHPGHEIPEKNWYYRIAKRLLFNDFGVYAGQDHSRTAAPFLPPQSGGPDSRVAAAPVLVPLGVSSGKSSDQNP